MPPKKKKDESDQSEYFDHVIKYGEEFETDIFFKQSKKKTKNPLLIGGVLHHATISIDGDLIMNDFFAYDKTDEHDAVRICCFRLIRDDDGKMHIKVVLESELRNNPKFDIDVTVASATYVPVAGGQGEDDVEEVLEPLFRLRPAEDIDEKPKKMKKTEAKN